MYPGTVCASAKTAVKEPIIKYGFIGGWDWFLRIADRRAPDIEALEDTYLNINERQAALNIIKLEVDMEAFGLRYIEPGLNHRKLKNISIEIPRHVNKRRTSWG